MRGAPVRLAGPRSVGRRKSCANITPTDLPLQLPPKQAKTTAAAAQQAARRPSLWHSSFSFVRCYIRYYIHESLERENTFCTITFQKCKKIKKINLVVHWLNDEIYPNIQKCIKIDLFPIIIGSTDFFPKRCRPVLLIEWF